MIEEIHIRGLGVIDDAVLEPHTGFTVVTGETGAGKTMVLTGIGLLLGGKADAGKVRAGDERAEVEGRFRVPRTGAVAARVREAGGDLDEDALQLARTVSGEGRSRAYAGGRSAPASLLAELADDLVAVHGQSEQQRLLQPARQRLALDRYAADAVGTPYAAYRAAWERLRAVDAELAEASDNARERARELDLLRLGLSEVDAADPKPGEDDELRAEAARLAHAESLREAASVAHLAVAGAEEDGTPDVVTLLAAARRAVEAQREHDADLAGLADRLAEVAALAADVSSDLASYAASVDSDPLRLAAVQDRRALLSGLTRKYGDTVDEVLAWAERAGAKMPELAGDDARIAALSAQRDGLRADLATYGALLTAAREDAATRFGAAVTAELADLAMPQARLLVEVRALAAPGPHGHDDVELLLAPHAGAPARPLARSASGGELSRVMLAAEVVFAGSDPVPTMVFDEVDAGVGGKAAVEVGRRLARLARSTQVLVVTHLPQVAAFADRHVVVAKSDDGRVTMAGLHVLDGDERRRELARMMAGLESSEAAAAHADELLELARAESAMRSRRPRKDER